MLKLIQYPNKILKEVSKEIHFPLSQDNKDLANSMLEYVTRMGVAGIAAVQVGVLKRICVVTSDGINKPNLIINPKIIYQSKSTQVMDEGCLSINGGEEVYMVKRPKIIKVEYQDSKGKTHKKKLNNWGARVFLHESDHLDGILINEIGKPKLDQ